MNQEKQIPKVLFVANTARFFVMFEQNNMRILQAMGYEVHCASNFNLERDVDAKSILENSDVKIHQIDIARSPFSLKNIVAYRQLKKLMKRESFSLIDCHTPMGGVLARLAAKATSTIPVMYTAHGFHFYRGCPLKNRLIYETIERVLSRYTDILITINKEDYQAAQKFKVRGNVYKIPGIGIDVDKIRNIVVDKKKKRQELGLPEDAFVMLSVGDLIPRKNHIMALRAFAKANIPNSYYLLCGNGELRNFLQSESEKLGVSDRVIFLGFRNDIREILHTADLFCFPSLQEGLPAALMEAMAAGIPCVASRIRGNIDLMENSDCLFDLNDDKELAILLSKMTLKEYVEKEICSNFRTIEEFKIELVQNDMKKIYLDARGV